MPRADSAERDRPEGWEAKTGIQAPHASQPTPLAIVSRAVAGDGLERVASSASEALGHPVAIILPSLGAPVVWPSDALLGASLEELVAYATAAAATGGAPLAPPATIAHAVPIRIGHEVVGIVAAIAAEDNLTPSVQPAPADDPAWLEAVAAAAAVTRLMSAGQPGEERDARRVLLEMLAAGPPPDVDAMLEQGRRLGVDLSAGAIALCARAPASQDAEPSSESPVAPAGEAGFVAEVGPGRVLALVPLAGERAAEREVKALTDRLESAGLRAAASAPRRQPALLHEAVREAMLLAELSCAPDASFPGQEETYRLLTGVLLRDREELELLKARTISPLIAYDAEHDTELLVTLGAFLARHGSTTETAEAMRLHRHTVGYRLSRVQEVSGLSPYESDGRERLSLGLKAAQILTADERLPKPG